MRILMVSDSPLMQSAYATQALPLSQALVEAGHEVLYFGMNYLGGRMQLGDVPLVGTNTLSLPDTLDMLPYYAAQFKPDVFFTFKDPYIFPRTMTRHWQVPWVALAPVDSDPASAASLDALQYATRVITLTMDGRQALANAGQRSDVAFPALDAEFFTPGESTLREEMGIAPEAPVFLMIAANGDTEDRKNFRQVLLAWQRFVERVCPEAVLILHTNLSIGREGINLAGMLDALNYSGRFLHSVILPDTLEYCAGHSREYIRDLCRSADCLIAVGNEGFGMPVIEAAACGLPSLCLNHAGLKDAFCGGWQIPANNQTGQREWTSRRGSMWFRPAVEVLVSGFKLVTESYKTVEFDAVTRDSAQRFERKKVYAEMWLPLFAEIEAELKEAKLS